MSQPLALDDALARSNPHTVHALALRGNEASPDTLAAFEHLEHLQIEGATIDSGMWAGLQALRVLTMKECELEALPILPRLEHLELHEMRVKDYGPLASMPALTTLGLVRMGLRKVPKEVLECTGLRHLNLGFNSIGSLATLKAMPQLQRLEVPYNSLKKLHRELLTLDLRALDIRGNELADHSLLSELPKLVELSMTNDRDAAPQIPKLVFELTQLTHLALSLYDDTPGHLAHFEGITNLTRLEVLTLKNSELTRLPDGFVALKELRELHLEDNKSLVNIASLRELPQLERLDLTGCPITEIPPEFSTLKALRCLKLAYNKELNSIEGLRDLPLLEDLDLSCRLEGLPAGFASLVALEKLSLVAKITDLSALAGMTRLKELSLWECPVASLPETLVALERLKFSDGTGGDDSYLAKLTALRHLEVYQPTFKLPRMPQLHTLEVGRLKQMPDLGELAHMPGLRALSFNRSDLKALPEELALAPNVASLVLEFLDHVTDISLVTNMRSLTSLKVHYLEELSALPSSLPELDRLSSLELRDLDRLTDLSPVGGLSNLEQLALSSLPATVLPESFSSLSKLKGISIYSMDQLKSVASVAGIPTLEVFDVSYCESLKRAELALVQNAIAERRGVGELQMSYAQFMSSESEKFVGHADRSYDAESPLWIAPPGELAESVEDFSWADDHRDDVPEFAQLLDEPNKGPLVLLAVVEPGDDPDAYSEEFFAVDIGDERNPIYVWGHDMSSPQKVHDDFDAFLNNLVPVESDEGDDD